MARGSPCNISLILDPQAGFFLRTCPALAVGFRFRNRKLSSQVAEYLRNVCARKEDMHFSVCVGDTDRVRKLFYRL